MRDFEQVTIINPGADEWVSEGKRFRIIHTDDSHFRKKGFLVARSEDYQGEGQGFSIRMVENTARISALIGGIALSKPVYYSVLRLFELVR